MRAVPQKIQILKFIGEQGVVTLSDVAAHLSCPDKISYIRVTLYKLGIIHIKYRQIPNGVWFIDNSKLCDLLNSCYPDPESPCFELRPVVWLEIPHSLELNRIRTTFEQTDVITIDQWWSENYIRALPAALKEGLGTFKIPDAIFWRKKTDGSRQKYFLEYERTLKNTDRYEEIFCSYAKREDVKDRNVIYICATAYIKDRLQRVEEYLIKIERLPQAGLFQFITLEGFYETHANHYLKKGEVRHEQDQTVYANAQL